MVTLNWGSIPPNPLLEVRCTDSRRYFSLTSSTTVLFSWYRSMLSTPPSILCPVLRTASTAIKIYKKTSSFINIGSCRRINAAEINSNVTHWSNQILGCRKNHYCVTHFTEYFFCLKIFRYEQNRNIFPDIFRHLINTCFPKLRLHKHVHVFNVNRVWWSVVLWD